MRRALITGITGQDGQYLAELLHEQQYEVFGLVKGQNNPRIDMVRTEYPYVEIVEGDLQDLSSLVGVLEQVQPDEVYNLGAISFVALSFKQAELTANVTGLGVLRLLDAVRMVGGSQHNPIRFYQASSSEMFGKVRESPQTEATPFYPRSPYGVAKVFGHDITVNYRDSYGLFACSGILFNHESPRRGIEFVTDYVRAMWQMLQQDEPGDYVVATGRTHSVRNFVDLAFKHAGFDDWERFVEQDPRFFRPAEVDLLVGDATKAHTELGWKPEVGFEDLVAMMVDHDLRLEAKKAGITLP